MDWLPIETAPRIEGFNPGKNGPNVLLANQFGVWVGHHSPVFTSGFRPDNPWHPVGNGNMPRHGSWVPTHWMPLPEPPPQEKADETS